MKNVNTQKREKSAGLLQRTDWRWLVSLQLVQEAADNLTSLQWRLYQERAERGRGAVPSGRHLHQSGWLLEVQQVVVAVVDGSRFGARLQVGHRQVVPIGASLRIVRRIDGVPHASLVPLIARAIGSWSSHFVTSFGGSANELYVVIQPNLLRDVKNAYRAILRRFGDNSQALSGARS